MRIFSSKPINYINNRVQIPLRLEDLRDENVYEEMWSPWDDDPEHDVMKLMQQQRL